MTNTITIVVITVDGINPQIQTAIQTDGDDTDTFLDLSIVQVFQPLLQTAGMSTGSYLTFGAECTGPFGNPTCTLPTGATRIIAPAMNMGGGSTCLSPIAGTTRTPAYTPALVNATAPATGTCYVATTATITISLGGIVIPLTDAAIGAAYFGTPATELRNGLIRGFLSETVANATIIPDGTTGQPGIDNQPISRLLRGGTMNCNAASPMTGDTDTGPGGERGWYFYLNFSAVDMMSATGF